MADNLSNYRSRTGENTTRQFLRSGRFFQLLRSIGSLKLAKV